MTEEQYKSFLTDGKSPRVIDVYDLSDMSPRTLLYGYTTERYTWHVYIKDDVIYTVVYPYKEKPSLLHVLRNEDYVPNKRVYPEYCDYEFCTLLKNAGVYIPWTTYSEPKSALENVEYIGETL